VNVERRGTEKGERPHRFTGVVGAVFFTVGVLVIFFSATLPRASEHLRHSTFEEMMWSCGWYFVMRVLSEFAVIART